MEWGKGQNKHVAPPNLLATPRIGLFLIACFSLIALLPAPMQQAFALRQDSVDTGELWRLWAGHLVHWSSAHTIGDSILLLVAACLAERKGQRFRLCVLLFIAAPIISIVMLHGAPTYLPYRGSSALGVMVLTAGLVQLLSCSEYAIAAIGLAGLIAKIIMDAAGVNIGTTLPTGIHPAWQAHLVGMLIGILFSVASILWFTPSRSTSH